jgi:hypothetical protein
MRAGAEVTMDDKPTTLTRREALRGAAVLFGTISAGSVLATLAPSRAWALELGALSQPDGASILAMAQVLYPHADLPSAVYAFVVKDLDTAAAGDAQLAAMLAAGTAQLNAASGGSFVSATVAGRTAAVTSLAGSPFFEKVRSTCIVSLYNNELAFKHFGYEGAVWLRGGYLRHGFNDLAWLPNPPAAASPKPYVADASSLGSSR